MRYALEVMPREDRKALIERESKNSPRTWHTKFRGKMTELKQIRISISAPIYRMNNGRTEDEQNDLILKDGLLGESYFLDGEENVSPQRAQHRILFDMSVNDPLYEVLSKSGLQEEPLLITSTGVVVNGNRRLATMRELWAEQKDKYDGFKFIDVAILPPEATERDLDEIEVALQMAVETKQEYKWINQRLKMRHLQEDHKMSPGEIAAIMNYANTKQVNAEIQQLILAEDYLANYLKKPKDYKVLEDSEQIFKEIAQRVAKKNGVARDIAVGIAFTMVRGAGTVQDRLYSYRESFGDYADKIAEGLIADLQIPATAPAGEPGPEDDPLSGLEETVTPQLEELGKRLMNPELADDLTPRILTLHESIKNSNKESDKKAAALSELKKVSTLLAGVDVDSLDEKLRAEAVGVARGAEKRLKTISARLAELIKADSAKKPQK